jgi:hypothetical protein
VWQTLTPKHNVLPSLLVVVETRRFSGNNQNGILALYKGRGVMAEHQKPPTQHGTEKKFFYAAPHPHAQESA